jgi:hypothetical protein
VTTIAEEMTAAVTTEGTGVTTVATIGETAIIVVMTDTTTNVMTGAQDAAGLDV